jgi:SAM-dependent methyltransferase
MGAAHAPIWRRMIDVSVPDDLRDATVLDYGCNQGGFLRLLYDRHPFRAGVGLDIARESVARAELLKRQRPIEYRAGNSAAALDRTFDFAFSRPSSRRRLCRRHGLPHRQRGLAAMAQSDCRDLFNPDLRPLSGPRRQDLLRGGLHGLGAAAGA